MKKIFMLGLFMFVISQTSKSQVTIGSTDAPNSSAMLEIRSNGSKTILLPKVADTAAVLNPVSGMMVYATGNEKLYVYATRWVEVSTDSTAWIKGGNFGYGTNKMLGLKDSTSLSFITNNVERIKITGDGKVGIGVGNPADGLNINKLSRIQGKNQLAFGDYTKFGKLYVVGLGDPDQTTWSHPENTDSSLFSRVYVNDSVFGDLSYSKWNWLSTLSTSTNYKNTGTGLADLYGWDNILTISSQNSGSFGWGDATYSDLIHNGSGTMTHMGGGFFSSEITKNAKINDAVGVAGFYFHSGYDTVNVGKGVYAPSLTQGNSAGSALTKNQYGGYFTSYLYRKYNNNTKIDKNTGIYVSTGTIGNSSNILNPSAPGINENYGLYIEASKINSINKNYGIYIENSKTIADTSYAFVYNSLLPTVIDANGNIGIGTLYPDSKLHIKGNARLNSDGAVLFGDSTSQNVQIYDMGEPTEVAFSAKNSKLVINDSVTMNMTGTDYYNEIYSGVTYKNSSPAGSAASVISTINSPVISAASNKPFSQVAANQSGFTNYGSGKINELYSQLLFSYDLGQNDTVNNMYALSAYAYRTDGNSPKNGKVLSMFGAYLSSSTVTNNSASEISIDNNYGLRIHTGVEGVSSLSSITTNYGLNIERPLQTGGIITTNYGIYLGDQNVATGDNYAIFYNGASPFVLKANGNMGIGNTNPGFKLEVTGKVKAENFIFTGIPVYTDDISAGAGGVLTGELYRTSTGEVRIKL